MKVQGAEMSFRRADTWRMPSGFAAAVRPWQAMILLLLSIGIGWAKPKALVLSTIWWIWCLECVRAVPE